MTTPPPPIKPDTQSEQIPNPELPEIPTQQPKDGSNSNKLWLKVGLCLVAGLVVVAVVLFLLNYFNQSDSEYDDGNSNDKVLRQDTRVKELDEKEIPVAKPAENALVAGIKHGHGTNGLGSFSILLTVDDFGDVTGTYWNVLYNIKFNISGTCSSDGTLDLTLTTEKDNITTPLKLHTTDGRHFNGEWGKKKQPVHITLNDGDFNNSGEPEPDVVWHIQGPDGTKQLDAICCFGEYNGDEYMWYPDQGFCSRMKMIENDDSFTLYNYDGAAVAEITDFFTDGVTATAVLNHYDGKTFTLTSTNF